MTLFAPAGPPYLPGRGGRPSEELFAPYRDTGPVPEASPAFRAGLSAFAQGYYWEAHELWEPLWAALRPASAERKLVQGLIQLANTGLKARMGRDPARILRLADTALAEAFLHVPGAVLGQTQSDVADLRAQVAGDTVRTP